MQSTPSDLREPASPGAADAPSTRRRLATQHVREARDRLTSTSGTRPVFDYELLRQFAQNRLSGSLVIVLLVITIGLLSALWTGAIRMNPRRDTRRHSSIMRGRRSAGRCSMVSSVRT